jgi:hypothetical protein
MPFPEESTIGAYWESYLATIADSVELHGIRMDGALSVLLHMTFFMGAGAMANVFERPYGQKGLRDIATSLDKLAAAAAEVHRVLTEQAYPAGRAEGGRPC